MRSTTSCIASRNAVRRIGGQGGATHILRPDRLGACRRRVEALYERNQVEHRAIRQALMAGSVAGARELAREHVMHSLELLTTILTHVGSDWARS